MEIHYDCDLGGCWVEAQLFITEVTEHLSFQTGIPQATIEAHIIAAAGLCKRLPEEGEHVFQLGGFPYAVDELALASMKSVIFQYVSPEGRDRIVEAFMDEDFGDVHVISRDYFDGNVHWMVITAVLDVLKERDQLPIHPSWL